jgi:uncharacterized protein YndB with AHSA1/START domain
MQDMDVQRALTALAEPTRFRIVRLLAESPRTVGEVADALGALQPQTTKHLQVLVAADLVVVHRLGRRRVVALRREPFDELGVWFAHLAASHPSEAVLDEYRAVIAEEETRQLDETRIVRLHRDLPAAPEAVWEAWTIADLVRRWWAPEHFEVVDCEVEPTPGGAINVSLGEPDGATYQSVGRFLELERPARLRFEQSPLAPDGNPVFIGTYTVLLEARAGGTALDLEIELRDIRPGMSEVVAGVEIGWRQTLDRLAEHLRAGE